MAAAKADTKAQKTAETGQMLTGAEILLKTLAAEGVEVIFGYPGGAVLPIYDAIFQQNEIRHVLVRHEQGAAHAAEGYAPANTLAQLLSGRTDNPGHRILCLDMPARAGLINSVVMRLPTDYVAVLTARYCLPVEPSTGRPYEVSFLSELLGISTSVYRFRLHRAKVAYRQKIFSPTIASGA